MTHSCVRHDTFICAPWISPHLNPRLWEASGVWLMRADMSDRPDSNRGSLDQRASSCASRPRSLYMDLILLWVIHWDPRHMTIDYDCHKKGSGFGPFTKDIRIKIFGSPDCSFSDKVLSDGDSVYSREILFPFSGISVKTCLICTGTTMQACWKFGSQNYFKSDLLRPWSRWYMDSLEYISRCVRSWEEGQNSLPTTRNIWVVKQLIQRVWTETDF